jgi:hypothetical protein
VMVDLRNVYRPEDVKKYGFSYTSSGVHRPTRQCCSLARGMWHGEHGECIWSPIRPFRRLRRAGSLRDCYRLQPRHIQVCAGVGLRLAPRIRYHLTSRPGVWRL